MGVRIQPGVSERVVGPFAMRCPECRNQVTLERLVTAHSGWGIDGRTTVIWGSQRCPTTTCGALILFVQQGEDEAPVFYPAETVDFDATSLPEAVVRALEEAITCHAHRCYTAAALMVRKTLEEVCADRQTEGKTLFNKLENLKDRVILPQPMFEAMHNLRLLGNDAAHIESRAYAQVAQGEVDVALEVTKEILKATYQYDAMMGKLAALKTPQDSPPT